jgi:hypothetical protein
MLNLKGIDDLLASGGSPRRLVGDEVEDFFSCMSTQGNDSISNELPTAVPVEYASDSERPPFPVGVFPEPVARFIAQVADAMGCPVDFPAIAVLTVAGAAIGAARTICVKDGWFEKPALYAVIVASPGQAKTPALKAVMTPVYEEQARLHENYKQSVRQYKEETENYQQALHSMGDAGAAHELPSAPQEPPPMRHLFSTDTTTEALGVNLESNRKGILLFRDELTGWVESMNQYRKGADRQFFLSAWSGEMVKVDRKGNKGVPLVVPYPLVSVLGGIQPDLLSILEAERNREDGFLHRILFSFPAEQSFPGWSDNGIGEAVQQEWSSILQKLFNLQLRPSEGSAECPQPISFTKEGQQLYIQYVQEVKAEIDAHELSPRLIGVCAKLKSYTARFALILHYLRWATRDCSNADTEGNIDVVDVAGAVQLSEYFRQHAAVVHQCLRQSEEDKKVVSLVKWLQRKNKTTCTVRDVCRANIANIRKKSEALELFKTAADFGIGELDLADPKKQRFLLFSKSVSRSNNPTVPTTAA